MKIITEIPVRQDIVVDVVESHLEIAYANQYDDNTSTIWCHIQNKGVDFNVENYTATLRVKKSNGKGFAANIGSKDLEGTVQGNVVSFKIPRYLTVSHGKQICNLEFYQKDHVEEGIKYSCTFYLRVNKSALQEEDILDSDYYASVHDEYVKLKTDMTDALAQEQERATQAENTISDNLAAHLDDKDNPHDVTKNQLGLGNVEDKSSATIRQEITKTNVTDALGYTPYTPNEVDNKLSALETNIDWKESVDTFDSIAATYPNPSDGWTVNVKDTDYTYRYDGTEWVVISANAIPKATNNIDGLLGKEEYAKYEEAYNQKHSHSNTSVLEKITEALFDAWNNAVEHISDSIRHITSSERTLWNTVSDKVDKIDGKSLSANDFTDDYKSTLDNISGGTVTGIKGNAESSYRTGNVNLTKENIGLGNVGNFKAVSTSASQGLSDTEKSNARTNIGAGTSSFSGSYNDLSNKPSIPSAVTVTNNLTSDSTTAALSAAQGKELKQLVDGKQAAGSYASTTHTHQPSPTSKAASTISLASSTTESTLDSVTLPAGTWLIKGSADFASNSSSGQKYLILRQSSTSGTRLGRSCITCAYTTSLEVIGFVKLTSSTTIYLRGYQNCGSTLSTTAQLTYMKLDV